MMWTEEMIEERFIEAAETERRLPSARILPSTVSGLWPEYQHTIAEMNQWGNARLVEHRAEFWNSRRVPPSAAHITRHEEVMRWTAIIPDESARKIVWGFAWCRAEGRSFSQWCEKQGISRVQAYRVKKRAFSHLAQRAGRNCMLGCAETARPVLQLQPSSAIPSDMLATRDDDEPAHSPTSMMSERAGDNPELRDFSWARKQAEREARRRQKLESV